MTSDSGAACDGARERQSAFAAVVAQVRRAHELVARLVLLAEAHHEVSAHGGTAVLSAALVTGLTVAAVLTLAIYSYAGERFAWLLVPTLLPLALLAGLGFAALWRSSHLRALAVVAPRRSAALAPQAHNAGPSA